MLEKTRVQGALEKLQEIGLEQMLICEPYAIYYFLGKMFYGGERFTALLIKNVFKQAVSSSKESGSRYCVARGYRQCAKDCGILYGAGEDGRGRQRTTG